MNEAGVTARLRRSLQKVRRALADRLGVDARALAAFRVALGALLLADLALRARNLTAFYTDAGVLPRALLAERYPAFASVSVHALSGAAWFQALLFVLAGLAALALLLGYRTKLATVTSWVLLVSLHARNPLVLNAGDSVLRRLLFWSILLPLGARWSVDAAQRTAKRRPSERDARQRGGSSRDRVASVASAALLVQVVLVYAVNAVLKLRGDAWLDGTAVRIVFSLDQFTVLLGNVLAQYPAALTALGHLWLALLVCSPLLLVLRGWWRAGLAALFVGAHLGMLLTMRLGLFPLISMAALLPFLSSSAWDELAARVPRRVRRRLAAERARLASALPSAGFRAERTSGVRETVARWRRRGAPALAGHCVPRSSFRGLTALVRALATVFLVLVLVWTAMSVGVVATPDGVESAVDPEERRWDMFAPEPLGVDGWLVVPGELESGSHVDAFHGGSVEWAKPADVSTSYPTARWRKYTVDLWRSDDDALQHAFAAYLCGRWNGAHERDLVRVTPHYVAQETRLDGPEPTRRVRLVEHACDPRAEQSGRYATGSDQ